MRMDNPNYPSRFYLLDILRGLASLVIVIYHYKNFYRVNEIKVDWQAVATELPLSDILYLFYWKAEIAVYLFFVLSGFVFFLLYLRPIQKGEVTTRQFAILRFARLYPLHIATLLIVAASQAILININGRPLNYGNNDLYHFMLNLFMISSWGFESGYSFNGPFWTVSVEVFLYILFFSLATYLTSAFRVWAVILLGVACTLYMDPQIGKGIMCFFAGGCACLAFRVLSEKKYYDFLQLPVLILAFIGLALVIYFADRLRIPEIPTALILLIFVLPLPILILALLQLKFHDLGRHFRIIGDITYATYLTHFPLQLLIAIVLIQTDTTIDFSHWGALLAYLAAVILISIPVYYYFELPARRYLRKRLLG